jgi:hypothetical protein
VEKCETRDKIPLEEEKNARSGDPCCEELLSLRDIHIPGSIQ